jgi:hypothetical protein
MSNKFYHMDANHLAVLGILEVLSRELLPHL